MPGLKLNLATIKIGLANVKISHTYGLVEDVPVKVKDFTFFVDFVTLEMKKKTILHIYSWGRH